MEQFQKYLSKIYIKEGLIIKENRLDENVLKGFSKEMEDVFILIILFNRIKVM